MAKIAKWGFGCAPMKSKTLYANKRALFQVLNFISEKNLARGIEIADEISIVKGLFNRILRQDQWDWFTVNMFFDYPRIGEISKLIRGLTYLRTAIKAGDERCIEEAKRVIRNTNFSTYAQNFIDFEKVPFTDDQYIYVLSRREEKELLKIGMTARNVIKRVQEINAATGVVYPLSPRIVFRVTDCLLAEKLIHQRLAEYRLRDDREFFLISFRQACEEIDMCLTQNDLYYYKY